MASSCVPASHFESPRLRATTGDLDALLRRRRVIGLAEMMNFPGRDRRRAERARVALARSARRRPRTWRPGCRPASVRGRRDRLGDHEAYTAEEGRERLRAGMWLLIRARIGRTQLARAAAAARPVRARPDRVLHHLPRARAHRRRRSHQLDRPRRRRRGDLAGGCTRLRDAEPRALAPARPPRRRHAGAPPTCSCLPISSTSCRSWC